MLVVAVFTWTEAAWAQVPDDVAAVDQYRETIPTGAGGTGVGTGTGDAAPLSSGTRADLSREAGEFATTLEEIATSPALGAPSGSLDRRGPSVRPDDDESSGALDPSAASAAVSAVSGDAEGRVVGLLIALLVISALVAGGAALRQRV
jgi:hypothetical protein